ncbi:EPIDERMAL PATTERNING FACTOR-like protein 5 [Coffea eugenioides]|uniref:EPIDERMAL PATTERNING FACTOR-like protein 5 n=1 Tax=Coffea eugenioides TaxID=49369 RepID=UPI000F60FAB5|nr:EPIDERMAL PATTERNING FACTOR-like protein 5 [Coffea eugenioides]
MHMLNLVCITSCRPLVPNGGHAFHSGSSGTEQSPPSLNKSVSLVDKVPLPPGGVGEEVKNGGGGGGEEKEEVSRRIGSSPPSCDHKCFGCMPCEAIQVPTTHGRVGVQYANYEPEGWKCKCGPTFYTP